MDVGHQSLYQYIVCLSLYSKPVQTGGAFLCVAESEDLVRTNFEKSSGMIFNMVIVFYLHYLEVLRAVGLIRVGAGK